MRSGFIRMGLCFAAIFAWVNSSYADNESAPIAPSPPIDVNALDLAIPAQSTQQKVKSKDAFFYDRSIFWASGGVSLSSGASNPSLATALSFARRIHPHRRIEFGTGLQLEVQGLEPALVFNSVHLDRPTGFKWYTRYGVQVRVRPEDRMVFFLRAKNWQVEIGRGAEFSVSNQWAFRLEPYATLGVDRIGVAVAGALGYAW